MIEKFEVGKYYCWEGSKCTATASNVLNDSMAKIKDGKPHKCIRAGISINMACADFEGVPEESEFNDRGGWSWFSVMHCFEEVEAPFFEKGYWYKAKPGKVTSDCVYQMKPFFDGNWHKCIDTGEYGSSRAKLEGVSELWSWYLFSENPEDLYEKMPFKPEFTKDGRRISFGDGTNGDPIGGRIPTIYYRFTLDPSATSNLFSIHKDSSLVVDKKPFKELNVDSERRIKLYDTGFIKLNNKE